jgi:hypothetical protein
MAGNRRRMAGRARCTSPRASVSDTNVWQFAVLPTAEAYCAATPTECVPVFGTAVSSVTKTASLVPTSRFEKTVWFSSLRPVGHWRGDQFRQSLRRFWAVAARRNSSWAPHGPRSRRRSRRRMRLRCATNISTFFRGDADFDHAYYADKHLPMVMKRLNASGMLRYEVDKRLAGGGPGARKHGLSQELFAHVFEEVLLAPALEHAVGDLDVAQVPSTGDHLRLMAAVAQARDLP